jgi:hypothetical protein
MDMPPKAKRPRDFSQAGKLVERDCQINMLRHMIAEARNRL